MIAVNNELEKIRKETVVELKDTTLWLPEGTEENHDKPHSG
jgi:hypothetical protein